MPRFFLSILLLALVFLPPFASPSSAQEFDPSPLIQRISFLSDAIDVTDKIKSNSSAWNTMEGALPNLKRIYVYQNPKITILVGWNCGIDDFSRFTFNQFKSFHEEIARQGALLDVKNRGGSGEYKFLTGDPITASVHLDYIDAGYPYKDIALDIFATTHCVFSIKVSARQADLTPMQWNNLEDHLTLIRHLFLENYGTFKFSEKGSTIWWSSFILVVIEIIILIASAFILSILHVKFVSFQPGSGTQRYSLFIMAITGLAAIIVSFGLLVNKEFGPSLYPANYTMLFMYIFTFFVHFIAYRKNQKRIVAFAIWFVLSSILFTIIAWLLKWQPYNVNQLIGLTIGFIVALIALGSGYREEQKSIAKTR